MARIDLSSMFQRQASRLQAVSRNSERAVVRATSTLARRLPVEARRGMQAEYNLTAGRITAGLYAARGDGYVDLTGKKRGIGLIEFGGRWGGPKSSGATASVRRGEGGEYGGAFIRRGRGGNRQIFVRTTDARLPLRTLYGPSVAQMLQNAGRRERLADFAQQLLAAEINRQLSI